MASRGLGTLTLDLIAKIGGFTGPLSKAERELDARTKRMNKMAYDFGRSIGSALKSAAGGFLAFAGVTVSIGAASNAIRGAIDRADQLRDASIRLGVGVDVLSAYGYAAQQTGTDVAALEKGLKLLSKSATEALDPKSKKAGLFDSLGVTRDALTDLNKLVPQVADAFAQLPDGPQKAALAMQLFGKSGADLIEFLNQGGDGLKQFTDRARELGIVIDQQTADAADEFNDKLGDLKAAGTGLATQVASELLPQLSALVDWATEFVSDGENARQVADDLKKSLEAVGDTAQVFGGLIDALQQVRDLLASAEGWARSLSGAGLNNSFGSMVRNSLPEWMYQSVGRGKPDFSNVQGSPNPWASVRGGSDVVSGAFNPAKLNRYLATGGRSSGGGGGKSRKAELTDEQKAAKQLEDSYKSLLSTMNERVALFGAESEVAKLSYDLQNGELAKLTQAQKDELMVRAIKLDAMESARKEIDAEAEAMRRQNGAVGDLLKDLEFESELLGKTREEQEILNNLRYAGVDANTAYGKSIVEATKNLQEQREAIAAQIELADGVRDAFGDFFTSMIDGSKSVKEAFRDLVGDILAQITRIMVNKAIEQMFGQYGSTQGGQSGVNWGAIIGSFFGGGKASGGWAAANTMYQVNERGFEMATVGGRDYMLTGPQPVHITPNHKLGGGRAISQNFYTMGVETRMTQERKAQLAGREARRAMARTGR